VRANRKPGRTVIMAEGQERSGVTYRAVAGADTSTRIATEACSCVFVMLVPIPLDNQRTAAPSKESYRLPE
jgi:hypothetical protein